jgi:hypothetical protein
MQFAKPAASATAGQNSEEKPSKILALLMCALRKLPQHARIHCTVRGGSQQQWRGLHAQPDKLPSSVNAPSLWRNCCGTPRKLQPNEVSVPLPPMNVFHTFPMPWRRCGKSGLWPNTLRHVGGSDSRQAGQIELRPGAPDNHHE